MGIGLILIIIGLVLSLASGGYIAYETYFAKPAKSALPPPMTGPAVAQANRPNQEAQRLANLQQQKFAHATEQKGEERRALLKDFERSGPTNLDDLRKIDEKPTMTAPIKEKPVKQEDFVPIEELKKKEGDKAGVFGKLAAIATGQKDADKTVSNIPNPTVQQLPKDTKEVVKDATQKEGVKDIPQAQIPELKVVDVKKGSKKLAKSPKKSKRKKGQQAKQPQEIMPKTEPAPVKSELFEKLESISPNYPKEELTKKIAVLSGREETKISNILESESISNNQATSLFQNLDREKLTSEVFKDILSNLISTGKISRETVSSMLFEYMDKGQLSKRDVAKILSELKLLS